MEWSILPTRSPSDLALAAGFSPTTGGSDLGPQVFPRFRSCAVSGYSLVISSREKPFLSNFYQRAASTRPTASEKSISASRNPPNPPQPESTLRYRFHTQEIGDFDIHFRTLRDRQQFEDIDQLAENMGVSPASWPLFGMMWQAGEVLAQLMENYAIERHRILEVGCGVGLASLVLNKRQADISATDIHPSAQQHLDYNSDLNGDPRIPFFRSAWRDDPDQDFGLFDLIIASDVMFEPNHAEFLSGFINQYAKPKCEILMVDGGRGYVPEFSRRMEALDYSQEQLEAIKPFTNSEKFKGRIQRYRRGY